MGHIFTFVNLGFWLEEIPFSIFYNLDTLALGGKDLKKDYIW